MKLEISYTPPNIDKWEIEFTCPICHLSSTITLGQIRLEEYFICRGCHRTIKAIDNMGDIQRLKHSLIDIFK